MLAGPAVRDLILEQLNGIGNVMNVELNAHAAYANFNWGIQAHDYHGKVRT